MAGRHDGGFLADLQGMGIEDWKAVARGVKRRVDEERLLLVSAGVAFYGMLSLLPALVSVVVVYGIVADPQSVTSLVSRLFGTLSDDARTLVAGELRSLAGRHSGSLGVGLAASLLTLLWTASRGVRGLLMGVRAANGDPRAGGAGMRAKSLAVMAAMLVFGVLAIGAIAVAPNVLDEVAGGAVLRVTVTLVPWLVLAGAAAVGLAALYRYAPEEPPAGWRWSSVGALAAMLTWLAGSVAFAVYLGQFSRLGATYGSLVGVIVLMLWMHLSAAVVVVGAALNAELAARSGDGGPGTGARVEGPARREPVLSVPPRA